MNNNSPLPPELESIIGKERVEFCVLAKRFQPAKKSIMLIRFAIIWTAFTSIFVIAFFGLLFRGREVHLNINKVSTTASWSNFTSLLPAALTIGLFLLIGLAMFIAGFYFLSKKGGYFVGSESRLISYIEGKLRTYDWEQFNGNMEVDIAKGDISFQLRTGRTFAQKNSTQEEFVADVLYISGIENVLEVEEICRRRIKANDPTPAKL